MTTDENEQEDIPAPDPAAAPPEPAAPIAPLAEAGEAPAPEVPAAPPLEAMAAPAPAAEATTAPAPAAEGAPAAGFVPGAGRAPAPSGDRGPRRDAGDGERPARRHFGRRRVCAFCADKVASIDYKDAMRLRRFLSDRARIEPRRKTGTCAKHQRWLASALKRARHLAMLPYTPEHIRTSGVSTGRGR